MPRDQQTSWVNKTTEDYRGGQSVPSHNLNDNQLMEGGRKLKSCIKRLRADSAIARNTILKYEKNLKAVRETLEMAQQNYAQIPTLTAKAEELEEHADLLESYYIGTDKEPTPTFWKDYGETKDKRSWYKDLIPKLLGRRGKLKASQSGSKRGAEIEETASVSSDARKRSKHSASSQITGLQLPSHMTPSGSTRIIDSNMQPFVTLSSGFPNPPNPPQWTAPLEPDGVDFSLLARSTDLLYCGENSDTGSQVSANFPMHRRPYLSNPPSDIYPTTSTKRLIKSDPIPGLVTIVQDRLGFEAASSCHSCNASDNARLFMGAELLGGIPGSDVPSTSSLEPQMLIPYSLFPGNEELAMIGQDPFGPSFRTCQDDVTEWEKN